ncbi:amidohydrolase family protein [Micromonospora echinofusca]|uniref:Amidohydrolase family protein n=1 Tax=Micromonospora echinofusca TaxID=47858 RepID=A0ABS3VQM9_MICEH|nr:amidohydrolase family protein [Micromonospora echinofusca]MBO4206844.1 amidohydrolase family protein [Micromonospora echinofusca]
MRRADAHLHLFADGYPGRYGHSPAGGDELAVYQGIRRAHGISRALVVGYEGEARFTGNNAHIARLAATHDWIAPVAYVPPDGTGVDLEEYWAAGFVGIAGYLPDPAAADDFAAWTTRVAPALNRVAAVVSLNASPAASARLGPALAGLDGCTVLFSHLGLPGAQPGTPDRETAAAILAPLTDLARLPHVGVKISGLYAVSVPSSDFPHPAARPFVDLLLARFGTRRLYWGSDYAPALDHVSFAQTLHPVGLDGLAPDERIDILGGNLLRALDRR